MSPTIQARKEISRAGSIPFFRARLREYNEDSNCAVLMALRGTIEILSM
jgi:hypothetical protein